MDGRAPERLVGRADAVAAVAGAVEEARAGTAVTVLVSGSAGIGKSALLRASLAGLDGPVVAWGACLAGATAPGHWPWTQALSGVVRQVGRDAAVAAAGAERALLATLVPGLGDPGSVDDSDRGRLLLLDAAVAWLHALAADRPVLLVLDDLHWMDDSSLALLELLAADPRPARLCVVGAYRHDDPGPAARRLGSLAERVRRVPLGALDDADAALLVRSVGRVDEREVAGLVRRAGGHPLFLRELALAGAAGRPGDRVPAVVREAVSLRLARLSAETVPVLRVAALAGREVLPAVVADAAGVAAEAVARAVDEAVAEGMLTATRPGRAGFVHDVHREVVAEQVALDERAALHRRIGRALARRDDAAPAEVARHLCSGLDGSGEGLGEAVRWSLAAAEADRASLALSDAVARLRRLRGAAADAGLTLPADVRVEVLLTEADLLARAGRTPDARGLLRAARAAAEEAGDPVGVARAALAAVGLGARFAVRRDELVADLTSALESVSGLDRTLEARLTAALARELAHSVPADRVRSGPLAEVALELGRASGDERVLADCLLARHDLLWTPGAADERARVCDELVALARRSGDAERLSEALVLHANALLEAGRPAFVAPLDEALSILGTLDQPRHRYTRLTRSAALGLLRGDDAEALVEEAAVLGERLREPDAGNVRMSQRLELVRARAEPAELLDFADEAVRHWMGAPVHAHAVAAGFAARAGDLERARHHVATVADLGGWRADRSYLWSVFVRELAVAAAALADRELCADLLADLDPLGTACGVNGAVIAFAGCHAHTAGLLAAALGDAEGARARLTAAAAVYERLGAVHAAEVRADLDRLGGRPADGPVLARRGAVWEVTWAGRTATVRDCKGLHDIAALVTSPGRDIAALDLVGGGPDPTPDAVLDRAAVSAYRTRLAALSAEREEAAGDEARLAAVEAEHEALVAELGGGTGLGGRRRTFANHPAERARKAVTARIRDAVRRVAEELPDLAAHLDRDLVTGTRCRYTGDLRWTVR